MCQAKFHEGPLGGWKFFFIALSHWFLDAPWLHRILALPYEVPTCPQKPPGRPVSVSVLVSLERNGSSHDILFRKKWTSWWLNQPIWKIWVKLGIFPKIGMKIETIWNHHPDEDTDPFIRWIGDLSFWDDQVYTLAVAPHWLPVTTRDFSTQFWWFGNPEEGETIFFPPLLAKIGLHVVIGNHLPGRAMACRQWGGDCHCFVIFFFREIRGTFRVVFFFFCWMDFDGIWRRMKKLNGFLIDMISIFGSLRVLLFQGMAFLNNSGVWFEGTGNSTCRN